ncbi:MAG: S26 family signal peptidase [Bacteroidales bacterium]|jgi:signal peptidase I|nr:S26 family signal peptidase [Bacteroidales bacterium]
MLAQILFLLIIVAPIIASIYVIFKQQGRQWWEAIVSPWNLWILIKITNKSWWWILLLCIPFINFFVLMLLFVELSVGFKRNAIWEYFAAAVLPFLYFPYLIWVKKEVYVQPKDLPVFKKTVTRDWFDAIIFSVFAAAIVRMFFFENYTIPTSSMEKSMLIGDFVYVSKMAYGTRMPQTPIAFPLVHHTLPLTKNTKSYINAVQLDYKRFFQRNTVQRGDVVVFNFPVGDTVSTHFQSMADYYALVREHGRERIWNDKLNFGDIVIRPVDKRENFVKRCVAVAGDTFEIVEQQIFINGKLESCPKHSQFNYQILPNPLVIPKTKWREIGVSNEDTDMLFAYGIMPLTNEMAEKAKLFQNVEKVRKEIYPKDFFDKRIFPHNERFPWNVDNFGPIYIPQKGATIEISLENLPLYRRIITAYEGHELEIKNDQIFIDGKQADIYTFKMDYYWMMGDNRHNSADSRYWGFVPEDHIVGKPKFTWLSLDKDKSFPKKIRWKRMFRNVK